MKNLFFLTALVLLILSVCAQAQEDEAQQFEGFNLQGYTDEGEMSWNVTGDTADIVGDTINISNVDANKYGDEDVNLKAKTGRIDKVSGNIYLERDVVITSEGGTEFKTDTLDWNKQEDLVATDDPVKLTDVKKGMEATGIGLVAHPSQRKAHMKKDVEVKVNTNPDDLSAGEMVTVTCDGPMEIDQMKNKATFNENVVAVQTNRTLQADKLELYFDPDSKKIKEMICIGNVVIIQGDNSTLSDRAVYNAATQKLTLLGRPKLILVTEGKGGIASLGGK